MTTIYFTKTFTNGTLKGINYITSVTFDTTRTSEMVKWIESHKVKPVKSLGNEYIITDYSFQNYKRG